VDLWKNAVTLGNKGKIILNNFGEQVRKTDGKTPGYPHQQASGFFHPPVLRMFINRRSHVVHTALDGLSCG
jgi:hypothetical protein